MSMQVGSTPYSEAVQRYLNDSGSPGQVTTPELDALELDLLNILQQQSTFEDIATGMDLAQQALRTGSQQGAPGVTRRVKSAAIALGGFSHAVELWLGQYEKAFASLTPTSSDDLERIEASMDRHQSEEVWLPAPRGWVFSAAQRTAQYNSEVADKYAPQYVGATDDGLLWCEPQRQFNPVDTCRFALREVEKGVYAGIWTDPEDQSGSGYTRFERRIVLRLSAGDPGSSIEYLARPVNPEPGTAPTGFLVSMMIEGQTAEDLLNLVSKLSST